MMYMLLGDDHLILRGGGGLALLVGTDYLFSSRARPENLFPGKPRTENLFSTATNFWKSQKKGGLVWGFSRGGRTWLSMFCITFCRLLPRIAGDFVSGRIRTQENSYPKWLGTNSLVNSYPGTNYPENSYPIYNFYFDYIQYL